MAEHEISALSALRKSGVSFPSIAKILQRPVQACQVKAHKVGITYVGGQSEGYENINKDIDKLSDISHVAKGKIAEDITTIKLIEEEIDIFLPYLPNHQTDLIAISGSKVAKLQVKSGIWDQKGDRFRVPLRRKNARTHERFLYSSKDIDFFVFYCFGVDAIYEVPFNLCKKHGEANLYPHRTKIMISESFDWEIYRNAFKLIKDFLDN